MEDEIIERATFINTHLQKGIKDSVQQAISEIKNKEELYELYRLYDITELDYINYITRKIKGEL